MRRSLYCTYKDDWVALAMLARLQSWAAFLALKCSSSHRCMLFLKGEGVSFPDKELRRYISTYLDRSQ